jgi:hypothetical protein
VEWSLVQNFEFRRVYKTMMTLDRTGKKTFISASSPVAATDIRPKTLAEPDRERERKEKRVWGLFPSPPLSLFDPIQYLSPSES